MNDHHRFLVYLYNQAVSKYVKYKERLDKAVRSGRFGEFNRKEKSKLIHRLRKLKAKIDNYRIQLKVAIAAGALALTLTAVEPANAQANLGPFVQQKRSANPLRGPIQKDTDQSPVAVDIDNDGDKDVVVGLFSSGNTEVRFLKNNGTPTQPRFDHQTGPWVPATGDGNPFNGINSTFNFADRQITPAFADFDNDGDQDLVLGTYAKGFRYFVHNSDHSFTEQTGTWVPATGAGNPLFRFESGQAIVTGGKHLAPTFIDYDKDGDLDVVFGHDQDWITLASRQVHVIENKKEVSGFNDFPAAFTSTNPFSVVTTTGNGYLTKPRFADVDGLGDLDLFVGNDFGEIAFYRSNVAGNYGARQTGPWDPITKTGNPFNSITFADNAAIEFVDLDNDTDLDALVFGNHSGPKYESYIRYFQNQGNFNFVEKTDLENPFDGVPGVKDNRNNGSAYPSFIDVDADGDLDAYISSISSNASPPYSTSTLLSFYKNDASSNTFLFQNSTTLASTAGLFIAVPTEVDIDTDGDFDLFVSLFDGTIKLKRNDGGGTFTDLPSNDLNTKVSATSTAVTSFIDVDNDGDKDAFIARAGSTSINYFRNDGTPSTPNFIAVTGTGDPMDGLIFSSPATLSAADLNNDGFVDLIVKENAPSFRTFTNQKNGTFVELATSDRPLNGQNPGTQARATFVDIDQDGDKDAFVGSSITSTTDAISFFKNTNLPPDVVPGSSTITFTEGDPATTLASVLTVGESTAVAQSQSVDVNGVRAIVKVSGNYSSGQDVLTFTPTANITGTFVSATGELNLVGNALLSEYQTALRSIKYQNTSSNPSTATRTIKFYVFDHDGTDPRLDAVADGSVNVNVIAVGPTNNPPSLTLSTGPITYSGAAMVLDNGIVATDTEASIASGTVSITNFVAGEDELLFTNQNGITGSFNATTGVLTLTGTTTDANYQTALRSIQYRNNATSKTKGTRNISFQLNDGTDPGNTVTLSLTIPNQKPALTLNQTTVTFTGSDLLLDNLVTVTDTDDTNASSASVSITSGFSSAEDQLVFVNQNGIVGSYAGGTLSLTGTATYANYQTALQSIVYRNTAPDRTNANRTISWKINDGLIDSNAGTQTLSVPNQVPVVSVIATSNYTNGTSQPIDNALTLTDSDDITISSAVVTITSGFVSSEDRLLFTNQNGITGSFNTTTGVLTLTGTSSKTNYEIALRSVAYQNIANGPTAGNRTISFQVNDGQANSASVNSVMVVTSLAPVVASTSNTAFYLSGDLVINNTLTVTDGDNAQLNSATVAITSGFVSTEDQLVFSSQNGISGSFSSSTGTLTLTGLSSVANYQAALRSVQYRNSAAAPNVNNRVVTFAVNDGKNTSNSLAITMSMNRAPVVSVQPQATGAGGNLTLNVGSILSDPDNNLDLSTLQITSQEGADITIVNGEVVIDYSSVADFQGTDVLTINVCDVAGRCSSQTVNIEVTAGIIVFNGVSPNGDTANDFFKIRFLPPGSHVLIYNRWGDLVFDMPDYDNANRNSRFEGLNSNGNELTSGTYFYKIETPQGKSLTGYLTLKR